MRWQITKNGVPTPENFDDGLPYQPGEDGFTTDPVEAHAESLGCDGFNYSGPSTVTNE